MQQPEKWWFFLAEIRAEELFRLPVYRRLSMEDRQEAKSAGVTAVCDIVIDSRLRIQEQIDIVDRATDIAVGNEVQRIRRRRGKYKFAASGEREFYPRPSSAVSLDPPADIGNLCLMEEIGQVTVAAIAMCSRGPRQDECFSDAARRRCLLSDERAHETTNAKFWEAIYLGVRPSAAAPLLHSVKIIVNRPCAEPGLLEAVKLAVRARSNEQQRAIQRLMELHVNDPVWEKRQQAFLLNRKFDRRYSQKHVAKLLCVSQPRVGQLRREFAGALACVPKCAPSLPVAA
jgi:hypothetical protein